MTIIIYVCRFASNMSVYINVMITSVPIAVSVHRIAIFFNEQLYVPRSFIRVYFLNRIMHR